MTPSEIKAALSERHVVALTLKHEAASVLVPTQGWRRAPLEHRVAVASVLRNRVRTPKRFGVSFKDVCLKPAAFSCWLPAGGNDNHQALMARAALLVQGGDGTGVALMDQMLRECLWIADGLIADAFGDTVKGATHYHADWMPQYPAWAFFDGKVRTKPIPPTVQVGNHLFYAGIR